MTLVPAPNAGQDDWRTADEKAAAVTQALALRKTARAGGMRFEVYLTPELADWVLGLIEQGVFFDPNEAVAVMLDEHAEFRKHPDMRKELLSRSLQAAMNDPHPGYLLDEVKEHLANLSVAPRPEAAVWRKPVAVGS